MEARAHFEGFQGCGWAWFAILFWIASWGWMHGAERVVRLVWDPSPSPDVTGYVIVYGFESGRYVFTNDAARALQAVVLLPVPGETYYFAAQARNGAGNYSRPSNEVSHQAVADTTDPSVILLAIETAANTPVQRSFSPPAADPATIRLLHTEQPSHGSLIVTLTNLTYVPHTGYTGVDNFRLIYGVDKGGAVRVEVSVIVKSVNAATIAAADDFYTTPEDTLLTGSAPGILANDSDVDGHPLNAVLVSSPGHGTLTLNGDGSFSYTPVADYNGTDSFTYKAGDGSLESGEATVTIEITAVNDAPAPAENVTYAMPEDTTLTVNAPGVLGNDSDIDGEPLNAVLVSSPAHGAVILNADGSFSYTPDADYNGTDNFTCKVSDGNLESGVATVTITITPVNDVPVAAADETYTTPEDTPLTASAPGVLANDSDVDGDPLNTVLVIGPAHGTLALNGDGSFSYTPAANYNGTESFTYKAGDGNLESAETTVTITVTPVNDAPPAAADDTYTTPEDTPLTVSAPGILANDSDADGDALNAALVSGPAHGTLALNGDGSFGYTPAAGYTGTDLFTYKVSDGDLESGEATVSITITPVNDAPVAYDQIVPVMQGKPVQVNVRASDEDSPTLEYTLVSAPRHGELQGRLPEVVYIPSPDFEGTDDFTFVVSDGLLLSAVARVELDVVNQPPVVHDMNLATRSGEPLSISLTGEDPEQGPLAFVVVTLPRFGVLEGTLSNLVYRPPRGFFGTERFLFAARDDHQQTAVGQATIVVSPDTEALPNIAVSWSESGELELTWPAIRGMSYQVFYRPDLLPGAWTPAGALLKASSPVLKWRTRNNPASSTALFQLQISGPEP